MNNRELIANVLYHDECDVMSQLALPAFAKTIRNRPVN